MRKTIYISFIGVLLFSFCRKDKGLNNYGNYPHEIGKIFLTECASSGCHNTRSHEAAGGLNLESWDELFKGGNSGSTVIPFRSDFSSLCYFINTYSELGPTNLPTMPLNRSPLSREEVQRIKDWIDAGAPDLNGHIKWADDPNRKKFYVTNQGCDVVTVMDAETNLPMRYITVGKDPNTIEVPHMIKISPDKQYWYVVFVASNILQKYRCSDDALVGEVSFGPYVDWNTITITDDGKRAYCVSWNINARVASVDLTQMKLIQNVGGPLLQNCHGIALNGTNDTLYITAQTGNYICKLDTGFTSIQQISLESGQPVSYTSSLDPHEILLSPDKQSFYISCQKSNEIRIFDIASQACFPVTVGQYPQEMVVSATKNNLYITCPEDITSFPGSHGSLSVLNLTDFSVQKIQVGFMPHGIGINESKNTLYIANRNILSNGPAPHHSSVCSGRNGFINYVNLTTLSVSNNKTEISVDPYSISVRY